MKRIVVAGTHSGVGKTTVATGIMSALRRRGLRVQAFKVGPDFIDPTFHHAATGRPSYNLDGWMLSREANLQTFARHTADADVAVIEGVMGLFDGKGAPSLEGSTAEMAIWLDAPVVLVLDASAMAGSAAAVVHGFDTLLPELPIAAVVCNKVAGERHYEFLRDAISARCRPPLLGFLPKDTAFAIPERHLGLRMSGEVSLDGLAEWLESHLDLDRLLALAMNQSSKPTEWNGLCGADLSLQRTLVRHRGSGTLSPAQAEAGPTVNRMPFRVRIGIARDAAFCFYYQDNLDLLRECGAELIKFSPIADGQLPPALDGLYLGGGYPELHAEALSTNDGMRRAIVDFVAADRPVYAECGGFMYLTEAIVDTEGRTWPMAGIFPTVARMQKRLAKLGYIELENGARGHEFRYSTVDHMPAGGYHMRSARGSYVHVHFRSCPAMAEKFVHDCAQLRAEISK